MILAGYETTANALGFTLYLLAANPDAQDRLAAEVDGVLGASAHAGYQELDRMPYMDACLREGLRCEQAFSLICLSMLNPERLCWLESAA